MQDPAFDQDQFRFRNDDGGEAGATWIDTTNTNVTLSLTDGDRAFRLRLGVEEVNGEKDPNIAFQLQYALNGGTWTDVGAGTPVQYTTSANYADGDNTTQQISTGTYLAGRMSSGDAIAGDTNTISFNGGDISEQEFALLADASQLVNNDTLDFRLIQDDGTVFSTYTDIPQMTAQFVTTESPTITAESNFYLLDASEPLSALTWETATDWDNRQAESGVVHNAVSNTYFDDASVIVQGDDPTTHDIEEPEGLWPLHEQSGTTAYGFGTIGSNGTYNGATKAVQPFVSGPVPEFTRADLDYIEVDQQYQFPQMTCSGWFYPTDSGSLNNHALVGTGAGGGAGSSGYNLFLRDDGTGNLAWSWDVSDIEGTFTQVTGSQVAFDTWTHVAGTYDGSDAILYINGQQDEAATGLNYDINYNNLPLRFGVPAWDNTRDGYNGYMASPRIDSRAYTATEVQTLYEVYGAQSSLTTTKQ